MKLWAGRFSEESSELTDKMNSSISFDKRLYKVDIEGSIAHVKMLAKCGIICSAEGEKINEGLIKILHDIENGILVIDEKAEDIHMFIESKLIERIGESGKKVHTGRSRNDQVALDIRSYLKVEIKKIIELEKMLAMVLLEIAEQNIETLMPGLTHLQKAQPITFGFHMSAYVEMVLRDIERFREDYKRVDTMPLGSGALAGTTYPIDREFVAFELGYSAITLNALDGVSDRDFVIETISNISISMMHLSRLAEELIIWSTDSFGYIMMDDKFSTGSSIMPQKKNPDIAELVRGKTGRVYGSLMAVLTVMKGLPLAYNKDMQEDKEPLFDAIDTLKNCLKIFSPMLATMKINKVKMEKATETGFMNATELADYLVSKDIPFRTAHEITGVIVKLAELKGLSLEMLPLEDLRTVSDKIENDVYKWLDHRNAVNRRDIVGGPAPTQLQKYIDGRKEFILNM